MIQTQIKELMMSEMDRRKFLSYAGGLFLAIVGITGLLHALSNAQSKTIQSYTSHAANGYGDTPYGN
jgi:hypothetical protein